MLMHNVKTRRADIKKSAKRPVPLAKPDNYLTGLALTLHNGLNLRGRAPSLASPWC